MLATCGLVDFTHMFEILLRNEQVASRCFPSPSNQLTELPREVCQMPLQVLLVPDNLLATLPKEIGKMTSLAELDASNNRLTQVPMTLGDCAGLRALDLSNNQLGLLPLQITYLRLEHLDVSCNCISSLPLELRNMNTLVTLNLDNNPLVSPPTTVCMRGRVHIFKYLENMSNKDSLPAHRRVDETRRSAKHTSYISSPQSAQITSGNATIDCLRHKPRHVIDSGYCTDGVDKRWSNDGGGEGGGGSGRSTPSTPSTLSPGAALSRAQSLSSESPLAPLTPLLTGLRISPEGNISNGDDKTKLAHQQTYRQYKEALRQQRQQDIYRPRTEQPSPELDSSPQSQSPVHFQRSSAPHSPVNGYSNVSPNLYNRSLSSNSTTTSTSTPNTSQAPNSPLLHSTPRRFQNQNGNSEKTEETNKRPVQKVVPSRNVNKMYTSVNGNVDYARVNGQTETYIKPSSPTKSPTNTLGYNSIGMKSNIPRQTNGGEGAKLLTTTVSYLKGAGPKPASKMAWNKDAPLDKLSFTMKREFDKQKEESELLEQLRTIIESRLKMSLPEQLAPVLADGVVLCHLANHVRPRAVASVHVPSPAQELICSPADILGVGNAGQGVQGVQGAAAVRPLACTVVALTHATHATHATPHSARDIQSDPQQNENAFDEDMNGDPQADTIEVNYQRQLNRYAEDRCISNFNFTDYANNYTIDESEEFYLNYENNNETNQTSYSPVYEGVRNRGPYYVNNRIQFVTPFCKGNGVLQSDNIEIYDTDEVDFPVEMINDDEGRYDRDKLNLDLQNNINREMTPYVETDKEREHRLMKLMCCAADVLEGKGTVQVAITVTELLRRQAGLRAPAPLSPVPAPAPPHAT
ncbi:Leucine-rich repeat and calponin-likey domain-containing protein 3 [Papilio machaon]|uniref:Leucine-rich repeat and calponin-likey domain-containing protein 3 n=1 Tax=Papilio machaon TaxID=76193 RepID=A0A194R2W8_PAPMA|nr:Leucine-rich repeat and calponin-likey domain-containing protein 3 [Papilio machaon]